jgi:hypothetical protein
MSSNWRPQQYRKLGQSIGADSTVLDNAIAAGTAVIAVDPGLPPVFTLRHLAALTGADYDFLRAIAYPALGLNPIGCSRSGRVFASQRRRITGSSASPYRI